MVERAVQAPRRARRTPTVPAPRLAAVRVPALVFLLGLGMGVVFFGSAWRDPTTTWVGDIGDPEQFQVFLAWTPYALGHGLNPFVTHHLLYPGGANLMWNTSVFLPALLVSPVTVLFGPTVAYDVLMVLAPAVSALAAWAAFRRWTGPAGAAVGGLAFATCPFFVAHASGHLHLMLLALVPLTMLLVDEVFVRQRWRPVVAGTALGATAAAQLLTAEEVLALDVLVGALAVLLLAVSHPRQVVRRLRHAAVAGACALGAFGVLAGYPLYVQFLGPERVTRSIHAADFYTNDLAGTVWPANQLLGWSAAQDAAASWTGNSAEWNGYLGIPLLILVAVLLVTAGRRAVVWVPAVLTALVLVFSLGSRAHLGGELVGPSLPWAWVGRAPLLHQVLPARFGLYADLFAALLVAVFVDRFVRTGLRPWRPFVGGVLAGGVLLSWLPHGWHTTRVEQPAWFRAGHGVERVQAGSVAVVLPYVTGPASEHAELWQARAGFRFAMPEGYLIVPGPHHGPDTATLAAFGTPGEPDRLLLDRVRAEWRRWGVRTVVVGPGGHDQRAVAGQVARVLGRPPVWEDDVAVFTDVRLDAPGG